MKTKSLFLLPALIAGIGLILTGRVTAQTLTTLYSFSARSNGDYGTNSDGAQPKGLVLSGNTLYGTAWQGGSSGNGTVFKLAPDGTYLMLEMNCSANVDENVNFIGKFLYTVSTLYCMTQSLAQNGAGIGAAMGEPKARELAEAAGFREFRRLPIEDPFSVLYALRA